MIKKGMTGIQRGQAITFRLPSDTPDHILRQLQKLKDTERRNFSSKISDFVVEGVSNSFSKERETVTVPLPKLLSKEQRNWLKHAHSEALLGSIVYQLLADPIRATSVLASLNSNALDIDEALYLQEIENVNHIEDHYTDSESTSHRELEEPQEAPIHQEELEDDLMNFDWNKAKEEQAASIEDNQEDDQEENLLGDFLAQMNK